MGARSYMSFGNDDALDFVAEVEEDGMPAVANAFEVVRFLGQDAYLEAPDACVALAAAEFVAAAHGRPPADFPPAAAALVGKISRDQSIRDEAAAAVKRVLDYSGLKDLWADSKDFDKWRADVHALLERLT